MRCPRLPTVGSPQQGLIAPRSAAVTGSPSARFAEGGTAATDSPLLVDARGRRAAPAPAASHGAFALLGSLNGVIVPPARWATLAKAIHTPFLTAAASGPSAQLRLDVPAALTANRHLLPIALPSDGEVATRPIPLRPACQVQHHIEVAVVLPGPLLHGWLDEFSQTQDSGTKLSVGSPRTWVLLPPSLCRKAICSRSRRRRCGSPMSQPQTPAPGGGCSASSIGPVSSYPPPLASLAPAA